MSTTTTSSPQLKIILNKGAVLEPEKNSMGMHAFPLYIEALSNINLDNPDDPVSEEAIYPANIFVFQKNGTGLDPNQGDRFMKVATAIDIDSYPNNEVIVDVDELESLNPSIQGFPFFRYNKIKLFLDYPEELIEVWNFIKEDVTVLVADYNRLQQLQTTASVEITNSDTQGKEIIE
jgi:hypothetical protein